MRAAYKAPRIKLITSMVEANWVVRQTVGKPVPTLIGKKTKCSGGVELRAMFVSRPLYIYTYIHTYTHTLSLTCINTFIHVCMYGCICTCTQSPAFCDVCVCVCVCVYVCM